MDYSQLSDRDIDRLVLNVFYGVHANDKDIQGVWARGGFKYTTNAADSWPIIAEHGITVACYKVSMPSAWPSSEGLVSDKLVSHSNPLRAAMTVFLMMQDVKNGKD